MSRARQSVYHVCRLFLGGLFLYAGVLKSQDLQAFAGTVAGYRLFPLSVDYLVAATLPWVEMLAGALLLANRHVRPAALVCTALTVVFVAALSGAAVRGLDIDCGCFGASAPGDLLPALLRDLAILAGAHMVFHLRPQVLRRDDA